METNAGEAGCVMHILVKRLRKQAEYTRQRIMELQQTKT